MSATGSRIVRNSSMRAPMSTRGSTTVLPAASAARTSGSVSHSLLKASVSRTVRDAANDGRHADPAGNRFGQPRAHGRREGIARGQHLLAHGALGVAQGGADGTVASDRRVRNHLRMVAQARAGRRQGRRVAYNPEAHRWDTA